MSMMKLRTTHEYPPIPDRRWDWSAVDDDTYEAGAPIGQGSTEVAAVVDLFTQLLDADEDLRPCQRGAPCSNPTACLDPLGCGQVSDEWWKAALLNASALRPDEDLFDLARLCLNALRFLGHSPSDAVSEIFKIPDA